MSLNLEADIVHYGQWGLFIGSYILGIWLLGYLFVVSVEKFSDIADFVGEGLNRRRKAAEKRIQIEMGHFEALKDLELEKLKALQAMELERARLSYESVNSELRKAVE